MSTTWSDAWDSASDWLCDNVIGPFLTVMVVLVVTAFVLGTAYGVYRWITYVPPQTFELRVDRWTCTKHHVVDVEVCGAKTGCHWTRETVCDEYSRRP